MAAVTVIIPTFNCADYLAVALDSLLAQTLSDWQAMIIDDGSEDHTATIVQPYLADPRIKYQYQENCGLPAARNAGVVATASEFVAFLDADDSLRADALELMQTSLNETQAGWCITDILKRRPEGDVTERSEVPAANPHLEILKEDFIRRAMFFRRCQFNLVGRYDEAMKYREDWDLNIRMLAMKSPFVYLPAPLYVYTWRGGSITTGARPQVLAYTERLLRKHQKAFADAGQGYVAQIYAQLMWNLARQYAYDTGDLRSAARCVRESLRYDFVPARLLHPVAHWFGRKSTTISRRVRSDDEATD